MKKKFDFSAEMSEAESYAALLFYWQSQREVSVVHKSMCEQ